MTRSAPIDRAVRTFLVLHTAVTSAPNAFAICTANVPTPPRRSVDEHALDWSDLPLVAKPLEGGSSRDWHRGGLLEGEVGRLQYEALLSTAPVLGEGPPAHAEHLIAGSELRHVLADRLDLPGHVHARGAQLGPAQPFAHADEERRASRVVPVEGIDGSSADPDEHAVIADHRLVDVPELEVIRRAVLVLDDRLHRALLATFRGTVPERCEGNMKGARASRR